MNPIPLMNRHRSWPLVVVLSITLFAGLDPQGYEFQNHVEWSADGDGLEFAPFSAAATAPFMTERLSDEIDREGFTLEIALEGSDRKQPGFAFIAQFYSGDDDNQLVLGQWSNRLIMMNGDDYRRRRRLPRIAIMRSGETDRDHLYTVTSDRRGTRFYTDGQLTKEKSSLDLQLPSTPRAGRLILGNSAYGIHPWAGTIRRLTLQIGSLSPLEVRRRHDRWRSTGTIPRSDSASLLALYEFDEGHGTTARDRSDHRNDLLFTQEELILEKQFLKVSSHAFTWNRSLVFDLIINVIGFAPFGAAVAFFLQGFGLRRTRAAVTVLLAAAALSLGIEWWQAWIPTRTSSALDLVSNTIGAGLGFAAFAVFEWGLTRRRDLEPRGRS